MPHQWRMNFSDLCTLKALGVKNSDEVIVPNLTFVATANSVILAGGIPKFCQIDDFSIDLKQAEKLITEKAIIPGIYTVKQQTCSCEQLG